MKLNTKFNIDDEIFFMNGSTPYKSSICGIEAKAGRQLTVGENNSGFIMMPNSGTVVYLVDDDILVAEYKAYSSLQELKDAVFKRIEEQEKAEE